MLKSIGLEAAILFGLRVHVCQRKEVFHFGLLLELETKKMESKDHRREKNNIYRMKNEGEMLEVTLSVC